MSLLFVLSFAERNPDQPIASTRIDKKNKKPKKPPTLWHYNTRTITNVTRITIVQRVCPCALYYCCFITHANRI